MNQFLRYFFKIHFFFALLQIFEYFRMENLKKGKLEQDY